ncbi:MAG: phosphatase PAP2 family protein [Pseudomonadota bacterium]
MQFRFPPGGLFSSPVPTPRGQRFWIRHLWAPLGLFTSLATVLALTDLDRRISLAWAFDPGSGTFPARNAWWAENLLHGHGRDLIWLVVLTCVAMLVLSRYRVALRDWRRPLCFVVAAIGLTTGLIGGLKQVTRVHCPWDLEGFGGSQPYLPVFGARNPEVKPGTCFPGAHAGSGFALFALYFALRDRHRRWARVALWATFVVGITFAIGQEARGAHFVSHDLCSSFLAWFICLTLYLTIRPARNSSVSSAPHLGAAHQSTGAREELDPARLI